MSEENLELHKNLPSQVNRDGSDGDVILRTPSPPGGNHVLKPAPRRSPPALSPYHTEPFSTKKPVHLPVASKPHVPPPTSDMPETPPRVMGVRTPSSPVQGKP